MTGTETYRRRLCDHEVIVIRHLHDSGMTDRLIAYRCKVSLPTAHLVARRKRYRGIPESKPPLQPQSCERCLREDIRIENIARARALVARARCWDCRVLVITTAGEVLGPDHGRVRCVECRGVRS